jgi:hypothetical protein
MRRWARGAAFVALALTALTLLGLIGAGVLGVQAFAGGMCGNEELQSLVGPDGRHRAVAFQRDCGATTGFSRQLSVLPAAAALPNEGGNVLAFGEREQPDPNAPGVGPQLQLAWRGADTLEVRTNSSRWRSKPPLNVDGVRVVFRPL